MNLKTLRLYFDALPILIEFVIKVKNMQIEPDQLSSEANKTLREWDKARDK